MAVSLFLILLSLQELKISQFHVLSLPFVFLFLIVMRLFDDIASAEVDKAKENRIYTTVCVKNELKRVLIALHLILLGVLSIFDIQRALLLLLFFALNQLLYSFLFKRAKCRYFLPLFKYPFVVFLLNFELSYQLVAVYFAFVIFEMLDDKTFPGYLLEGYKGSLINKKYFPYFFLFLFLLIHLILIY